MDRCEPSTTGTANGCSKLKVWRVRVTDECLDKRADFIRQRFDQRRDGHFDPATGQNTTSCDSRAFNWKSIWPQRRVTSTARLCVPSKAEGDSTDADKVKSSGGEEIGRKVAERIAVQQSVKVYD